MDDLETVIFTKGFDLQCERCQEFTEILKRAPKRHFKCAPGPKGIELLSPNFDLSFHTSPGIRVDECPLTPSVNDPRWCNKTILNGKAKIRYIPVGGGYFIQPRSTFDWSLFYKYWDYDKPLYVDGCVGDDIEEYVYTKFDQVPITFIEKKFSPSGEMCTELELMAERFFR